MAILKILAITCSLALFIAIAHLPIGYYTFLRVLVTIGAVSILFDEITHKRRLWAIIFLIVGVVFNPIFPVYLYDKEKWIGIDSGGAILFIIYASKNLNKAIFNL